MSQSNEVENSLESALRQSGLDPTRIVIWEDWLKGSLEAFLIHDMGRMSFSPYERFFGKESSPAEELNEFADALAPLQRNEFNRAVVLRIAKVDADEVGLQELELLLYFASRQRLTAVLDVLTLKIRMHGSNEELLRLVFGALGSLTTFAGSEHPHTLLSVELVEALVQADAFQSEWSPATLICLNNLRPNELVLNLQILSDHLDAELNSHPVSENGTVVLLPDHRRSESVVNEIIKVTPPQIVMATIDSSFLAGANSKFLWWTLAVCRVLRRVRVADSTSLSTTEAQGFEFAFARSKVIGASQVVRLSGWAT